MQQVYAARDAMEAHFVKGLLEAEEIEAVVQGEALEETWGDLPLTGKGVVDMVITDLSVFTIARGRMTLTELAPAVSLAEVRDKTEASFTALPSLA